MGLGHPAGVPSPGLDVYCWARGLSRGRYVWKFTQGVEGSRCNPLHRHPSSYTKSMQHFCTFKILGRFMCDSLIWQNRAAGMSRRSATSTFYSLFFFFFFLFTSAHAACGSLQARGWIGAVAGAYATVLATADPCYVCDLLHSLWQGWIFNPLSEDRDQTLILMDAMLGP